MLPSSRFAPIGSAHRNLQIDAGLPPRHPPIRPLAHTGDADAVGETETGTVPGNQEYAAAAQSSSLDALLHAFDHWHMGPVGPSFHAGDVQRAVEQGARSIKLAGALHCAIESARLETVQDLIAGGAPLEHRDADGDTPLMLAVRHGHAGIAGALLETGASANLPAERGLTPVMLAAGQGNAGLIRLLAHWKADVNRPDYSGSRALTFAARQGHVDAVKALLEVGAEVNAVPDALGMTAIRAAAMHGHAGVAAVLAQNRAHIHTGAGDGPTAMMVAALYGHMEVVAALSAAGTKIDNHLMLAARQGRDAMVAALLDAGARPEFTAQRGVCALMMAARYGHVAALNTLLSRGAYINAVSRLGWTATMFAVASGNADAVRTLMRAGNALDARASHGMTALLLAADRGHADIVGVLWHAGADMAAIDDDGFSAVMLAAEGGHLGVIGVLVQAGADIDAWLRVAVRKKNPAMVQTLLRAGADADAAASDGRTARVLASEGAHPGIIEMLKAVAAPANVVAAVGTREAPIPVEDDDVPAAVLPAMDAPVTEELPCSVQAADLHSPPLSPSPQNISGSWGLHSPGADARETPEWLQLFSDPLEPSESGPA